MYCWSSSLTIDDEFEKLVHRMNPPRVSIDNASDTTATLIKVDSANKRGSLLEVVQVLSDLNLIITRAYISSDGGWFMDVFHVTDEFGNKVDDDTIPEKIQQSLGRRGRSFSSTEHTSIELIGRDRPGLLSEVFAVLADHKCNVVAAEVWTHNSRMASVVCITDESDGLAISDPDRLNNIQRLLLYVSGSSAFSVGSTHAQRRLHQMMHADRDYDARDLGEKGELIVTVENCAEKGYTVLNLRCSDRPKLLFDTVCTITDMKYVVFHATIVAQASQAHQEYYIRHMDGSPISSEEERQRVINCLEAAIRRRSSEGIRLELCSEDRVGLLSDVTRTFRENGLSVRRAEVTTRDTQAFTVFYVTDASGHPVKPETIDSVRKEIGLTVLRVPDAASPPQGRFSLGRVFRTKSEKFLYNLGLIKSCS